MADGFRVGRIGGFLHLERGVVISERAPRVRQRGPEMHRALERRDRFLALAEPPEREAGDRERVRLVGNHLQDLVRLFRRGARVGVEQPHRIRECDIERAGGSSVGRIVLTDRLRPDRSLISAYQICRPS